MNIIPARERRENIRESILLSFFVENYGEAKRKKERKRTTIYSPRLYSPDGRENGGPRTR